MIYLGTDHRGFELKETLRDFLLARGFQVTDIGTNSKEPVDYPLIAEKVARKVVEDPNNRGILLCGSGAGMGIVANKVDGILAAVAWKPEVAKAMRYEDNINVLCLPADEISAEQAKEIAQTFLGTSFGGEERYKRRVKEIEEIERKNQKKSEARNPKS